MKSVYGYAVAVSGLLGAAVFVFGGSRAPAPVQQAVTDTGRAERYLTHLSTDKPIYRTGEKVYVHGVVLSADGHLPIPAPGNATAANNAQSSTAYVEIKGPKGDTVASGFSRIADSTLGFSWDIPASQAGGEYTAIVSHPYTGDAPAERKFDIRAYRAPRLKSQIVFVRDGYGPGDTVGANLHVERAEGGIPAGAKVSVSARVDGEETWKGEARVDATGNASANFKLPEIIARGEGTIAMIIEDGGAVETATKTIPILLQTLDLKIYPEGGDLVAGLPARVYLEGKTPAQKPADMAGVVVNAAGKQVAAFKTEHEGRGRFAFTPAKGESYSLRVTEPAGIKTVFRLPAVKDSGAIISATTDVTPKLKDVVVRVAATATGSYTVALGQRGKDLSSKPVALKANQAMDVTLTVPRSLDGVIVATVYDEQKKPLAERLLFRQSDRTLNVRVTADKADFIPGDRVTLNITTTDSADKPVGAVVGLTVSDSSVLEMIEKREQAPRLPVMVLLENDVRNLSDAHVYLDPANPKAPLATDLLLGTQGWRRFAAVDAMTFVGTNGDAGRRALGMRMVTDADRAKLAALTPAVQNAVPANAVGRGAGARAGGGGGAPGGARGGVLAQAAPPAPPAQPAPAPPAARAEAPAPVVNELLAKKGGVDQGVLAANKPAPGAALQDRAQGNNANNRAAAPAPAADAGGPGGFGAFAGGGGGGGRGGGRGGPGPAARNDFVIVRQYAHPLRANWTEGSRVDFAETVYWNAGVRTDVLTGTATVTFNLSDSVTSFNVFADGFAADGALGSAISTVESVRPFYIEPKLPLQITSGDVIRLPIGINNGVSRSLNGAEITTKNIAGIEFTPPTENGRTLPAKERARRLMQINIDREFSGMTEITLDAKAGPYRDTVTRKLDIQPIGFPFETSKGGSLESNGTTPFEFTLPAETVRGSVVSNVVVYPTPLASMTEALQALLRQPNGCFEQTSSTSYPLVMAQQYFLTHTGIDPEVVDKAKGLLEASYKRLTGFESKTKGYEWFGADPGHEALTAYGLMQFTDMAQVRDVDKEMIQRTRDWLLARRDGDGGFSRNSKALDSFGRAPQETTNAYITWALVESGQKGLDKEIAGVKASAKATEDTYLIALAANILHATGDQSTAKQLMDKLAKAQDGAGNVKGGVNTITRSGGDALTIETTALSVLAWMREPAYVPNVEKGVRWIIESNKNGRFGSTQSTILALRSIIAYDAARARPKAAGRLLLTVDGKPFASPVAFTADTKSALVMPEFGREIGPGKHTVALRMESGSDMPFSMSLKYFSTLPDSSEQTKVGIQVALRDTQIQEGRVTEATVTITNKVDEHIPTPVAIVGIPGGLEVRHDQLKELVKSGKIDAYEVIGREVVLYWRYLRAKEKVDLPLSLVAAVPGSYTGPASRTYLYYTDEFKNWAGGMKVNITPR